MTARIFTGADFRAKSLRNLSIEGSPRTGETADAPSLKSNGVSGAARDHAGLIGPAGSCADPVAGSTPASGTNLPYCDLRTLQEAERHAAHYAEIMAMLADRCADASVKTLFAAVAECAADDALGFREIVSKPAEPTRIA